MSPLRLLVTGGTGYPGTELARRARAAGLAVCAPGSGEVDVRRVRALPTCDAVVNCAYGQDTDDMGEVSLDGARNVARAAAAIGARLIRISTEARAAVRTRPRGAREVLA